ncbi:MAG TPA: NADP-dependent malic enzyme [Candidatus Saccharibacteria bacterium]|jgi:malate dehydrogenase (oxaloacetate-decarboxylating)|nr:NADP-dependent malic enzyme [Candidatus Saccharibacteria bacterium]HMT55247.1 NADP-dependent malic enzyme [Candidatus Saccharibacteria bacterium]
MDINESSVELHKKLKGKIYTGLRGEVTKDTLKLFYSPGVGAASLYAQDDSEKLKEVSWTNNLVAVISDGSAVLGLGDIGPEGALPVMEGKSMLFKHFANIDSVPIVLDVHTADEIVKAVKAIAPSFGGINLEDIAAPKCFEIEERLKRELNIPVMHDDQHGTAIVVLAGLLNAVKVIGKNLSDCKIVLVGAGAAGVAVAKLLYLYAKPDICVVDSKGIIGPSRKDLNEEKVLLMSYSPGDRRGSLTDALKGADIFIGLSKGGLLTQELIQLMNEKPIIFALANPTPEIMPDEALKAGAAIVATGRSDFPNQVNNALGFPGIFRGALDHGVQKITDEHKMAAAEALAALVETPRAEKIIPSPFDEGVVEAVSQAIY